LQKVKVELVEERSKKDIEVETVEKIYSERFQKFWIIIGSKNP
jgi:hypothetical protein